MPFDGTQIDETTLILLRARQLLAEGWCTRSRQEGKTFCAVGAVAHAAVGDSDAHCEGPRVAPAINRLFAAMTAKQLTVARRECRKRFGTSEPGCPAGYVAQFNNAQTSVEPILEWFDLAAKIT